ncbi:hypothetical protein K505DRAFT_390366 [Melanomma pulvis-pyrius CBS 109.77]|uniref:Uncharacterized protein n=1 Tax=Melanomma pulvis-pyrius CBS 109.77 TaxID=1314802 RepID=A0A6A6XRJ3_9PLEO|nr:hypothetical protein K505DRAFT_390366 [Melanomma pulvis-pyrius CBS 109.77]
MGGFRGRKERQARRCSRGGSRRAKGETGNQNADSSKQRTGRLEVATMDTSGDKERRTSDASGHLRWWAPVALALSHPSSVRQRPPSAFEIRGRTAIGCNATHLFGLVLHLPRYGRPLACSSPSSSAQITISIGDGPIISATTASSGDRKASLVARPSSTWPSPSPEKTATATPTATLTASWTPTHHGRSPACHPFRSTSACRIGVHLSWVLCHTPCLRHEDPVSSIHQRHHASSLGRGPP